MKRRIRGNLKEMVELRSGSGAKIFALRQGIDVEKIMPGREAAGDSQPQQKGGRQMQMASFVGKNRDFRAWLAAQRPANRSLAEYKKPPQKRRTQKNNLIPSMLLESPRR